jgi:hypothetical protein
VRIDTPAKTASAKSCTLEAAQAKLDRLAERAIDIVGYRNFLYFGTGDPLSLRQRETICKLNRERSSVCFFLRRSFCPWKTQVRRPQTDVIDYCRDITYGMPHEINRYETANDTIFAAQEDSNDLGEFKRRHATMRYPGKGSVKFWNDDPNDPGDFDDAERTFYLTDFTGRKTPHRSQTVYNYKPSKLDNGSICDHQKFNFARADKNTLRGIGTFTGILETDIRALIAGELVLCAFIDPEAFNEEVEDWIADQAEWHGRRRYPSFVFNSGAALRVDKWCFLFGNVDVPPRPAPWHAAPMVLVHRYFPEHIRRRHIRRLNVTRLLPRRIVEPMPHP